MKNLKFFKTIFPLLFATSICLSALSSTLTANTTTENVSVTFSRELMIDELTSKGIPHSFLENKPTCVVEEMYIELREKEIVSFEVQNGTAWETTASMQPRGEIAADRMTFTVAMMGVKDDYSIPPANQADRIYVMVEYDWAEGYPNYMHNDSIVVNWDSDTFVYSPDSFVTSDYYYDKAHSQLIRYYRSTTGDPLELTQAGLGYNNYIDIASQIVPYRSHIEYLYGCATFYLEPKNSPMYIANSSSAATSATTITAKYAHSTDLFQGDIEFEIYDGISVGFASGAPSYDYQTAAAIMYYTTD